MADKKEKELKDWIFIKKFYPKTFRNLVDNSKIKNLVDEIIKFLDEIKKEEAQNFNFNDFTKSLENIEIKFPDDNSIKYLKKLELKEIKNLSKNEIDNNKNNLKDKISFSNNIEILKKLGIVEIKQEFLLKQLEEYLEIYNKENQANKNNCSETINFTEKETKIFADFINNKLLLALDNITMITHHPKLSHSSALSSKIIANKNKRNDFPFLMSGNIDFDTDFYSHPKYAPINKFLFLKLEDGKRIFEHIKNETEFIKNLLKTKETEFEEIKEKFLNLEKIENKDEFTDEKIKQVYFPVNSNNLEESNANYKPEYNLLSILSATGMILKLKEKIQDINFSEKSKELKQLKEKKQYSKETYNKIIASAEIKYGGTQPQNISYLNTKLSSSILLSSIPPQKIKEDINFPKKDFFKESLTYKDFYLKLKDLAEIISAINNPAPKHKEGKNKNKGITNKYHLKNRIEKLKKNLKKTLNNIFDKIIEKQEEIREIYDEKKDIENLKDKLEQRLWLKEDCFEKRKNNKNWKDKIYKEIIKWIINNSLKIGKKSIDKDNKTQIEEILEQRQEELL